ncbi:MAG: exodeoxyribonuclease VII small subunit [Candidatus Jacksonbacteria bacterium RIFOXYA2_FULL_44_7]|uniref:Exodeoxyribonuclease 7 small subunit n=1 Tax=Candidatus Jacksonbacteria bacterium RIFCSPLOWO2_02_FULL_44_20 TaxID=1798460 RepID=A0A1G2A748_9BACT|nr:MAG: exodeoxyribonuclease 7 small subunit [Parcubacteria group bacterium GW2011_GWC2_44_17]KKT50481.1 MAG: exodeoxyribonuclease 7 small subunit [Parcubacteria group bacterium GW2011_GWF2_44_17]OGY70751.1 MAG: exodeoxyribonuclease VII small subunit [Candidatus Jacksonbacteria bacterium RIFCSPHIGHO2_12_FULL_44_12]OGY72296.1 MAG: exodeoxyribonuclease VII small subunit [Candidatus Jacksonbacteria bacterium RIFCSPLOWO2_02_FULL_44_20]OGY73238.1 MAG: exodeoxyribonuclease VII small subunit [Candidat
MTETPSSFEHAFKELEQIVHEFERGDVDLEGGIELFKRALSLATICKKRLQEVENQIVSIKKQFSDFTG